MDALIREALADTYAFDGWPFANEAESKHELFHNLAQKSYRGQLLIEQVTSTSSCRLHSEGKVENGNPRKADVLICEPTRKKRFNYEVTHLLELKMLLTASALQAETRRIATYREPYDGIYLVSARTVSRNVKDMAARLSPSVSVLDEAEVGVGRPKKTTATERLSLVGAAKVVREAIEGVLWQYGRERSQYHSYFWCNYEHEEARRHSYPCEGDFNAHLYHRLRSNLPPSIQIRSEVCSLGRRERIDFVIRSAEANWCIPIDVKMNWYQFKPSYKNGVPRIPEARRIIDRLAAKCGEHESSNAIVVVIQGNWRIPGKSHRENAVSIFSNGDIPVDLVCFDEATNNIHHSKVAVR